MKKKEQIDPELQKIKDEIEKQKAVYEPIKEQFYKEHKKLQKLKDELEKYRLEHGMFYPLSKLAEFKDKKIESVCFVQRTKNGKFKTDWIFNDELFTVYDDGKFHYSSYENGIIGYHEGEQKWFHDYCHTRKHLDDYVGFMKINFSDKNDYQVVPPDIETFKE